MQNQKIIKYLEVQLNLNEIVKKSRFSGNVTVIDEKNIIFKMYQFGRYFSYEIKIEGKESGFLIFFETGGKIERSLENHCYTSGALCTGIPDYSKSLIQQFNNLGGTLYAHSYKDVHAKFDKGIELPHDFSTFDSFSEKKLKKYLENPSNEKYYLELNKHK